MEAAQNHLESWAVVELMGHQKEVGFVTTQYYGTACMFKIDVPDLSEREQTLKRDRWIGDTLAPAGTTIRLGAQPGRTRLVGSRDANSCRSAASNCPGRMKRRTNRSLQSRQQTTILPGSPSTPTNL